MWGKRGRIWLAVVSLALGLLGAPFLGMAADTFAAGGYPPFTLTAAQTPLEAQMVGEAPSQSQSTPKDASALFSTLSSRLRLDGAGGAAIILPYKLEMHISVLYAGDPGQIEPQKQNDSMLMQSSLDYRLLPNLKVGLNAYLYRSDPVNNLAAAQPFGGQAMGVGPGLTYDLGCWSFIMKSQMETDARDRNDLQNWFRVWYAF
ncbi:MAG: hypothetical protein ACLP7A_14415 [Desulfobaccales bacterium]